MVILDNQLVESTGVRVQVCDLGQIKREMRPIKAADPDLSGEVQPSSVWLNKTSVEGLKVTT